jgi:hypothetical protein
MPKIAFTKKKIDSIKYSEEGQVIYWDSETPGLGLVVGTKPKGHAVCIALWCVVGWFRSAGVIDAWSTTATSRQLLFIYDYN